MTTGPSSCRAATRPVSPRTSPRATASCRSVVAGGLGAGGAALGFECSCVRSGIVAERDGGRSGPSCCPEEQPVLWGRGTQAPSSLGQRRTPGYYVIRDRALAPPQNTERGRWPPLLPSSPQHSPGPTPPSWAFRSREEMALSRPPSSPPKELREPGQRCPEQSGFHGPLAEAPLLGSNQAQERGQTQRESGGPGSGALPCTRRPLCWGEGGR